MQGSEAGGAEEAGSVAALAELCLLRGQRLLSFW